MTFDHSDQFTATTVAELAELVGLIEEDPDHNAVVFDSSTRISAWRTMTSKTIAELGAGPSGMPPWIDVLVRLARVPVELFGRPAQQARWPRLQALGLNVNSDPERSLGRRVVETIPDG